MGHRLGNLAVVGFQARQGEETGARGAGAQRKLVDRGSGGFQVGGRACGEVLVQPQALCRIGGEPCVLGQGIKIVPPPLALDAQPAPAKEGAA